MAYVQPDSKIYLLHNVPITNNYQHSICWKRYANNGTLIEYTAEDQYEYFLSLAKPNAVFNNQSYQRYKLGVIRVRASSEYLLDCNYLMFQNTHYGDKWFYAFITDVRYVNDNMTEVEYELDPIQTWYFETQFSMCGIERETPRSDGIGENIVPENLEIGKTMCNTLLKDLNYSQQEIVILCTKYPIITSGQANGEPAIDVLHTVVGLHDYYTNKGAVLYWKECDPTVYPAIPVNNANAEESGRVLNSLFQLTFSMKREYLTDSNGNPIPYDEWIADFAPPQTFYYPVSPNDDFVLVLKAFVESGFEDYIVAIYQQPIRLKLDPDSGNPLIPASERADQFPPHRHTVRLGAPDSFMYKYDNSQTYTPKNNKLYTAPYISLLVSNNNGDTKSYSWEDFKSGSAVVSSTQSADNYSANCSYGVDTETGNPVVYWDASVQVVGTKATQPELLIQPVDYLNIDKAWDYGIALSNFPQNSWVGDTFKAWLAQNKWSMVGDLLGATAQMAFGITRMATSTREVTRNIGEETLTSGVVNITKMAGRIADMSNMPNKVHGITQANYLTQNAKRYKFSIYSQTIWGEYAEIIDKYFTMFGYAVNKLGTPDICQRLNWTYIKTVNANQIGSIPDDESRRIEQIYNNGITFWSYRPDIAIGNYSQTNTPANDI